MIRHWLRAEKPSANASTPKNLQVRTNDANGLYGTKRARAKEKGIFGLAFQDYMDDGV
jgi:hypothetical protein